MNPNLFRSPGPIAPVRAVHLDLKGVPPTAERLVRLLDVLTAFRFNAVLVEWEDSFRWTVDERFRSETAYTTADVTRFHARARELGIQIFEACRAAIAKLVEARHAGWTAVARVREQPGSPRYPSRADPESLRFYRVRTGHGSK